VKEWREVYQSGIKDPNSGYIMKITLDDAAKMVGISRKTLDDYSL